MRTTFHKTCRCIWLCRLMLLTLCLTSVFAKSASAQGPYINAVSGGSCLGESMNLVLVGATATSWTVTPYVAGGLSNASSTGVTVNFIQTGVYTLAVTYTGGPAGYTTGTLTVGANVTTRPVPTLSVSESATVACVGTTVTYTASATNYGDYIYCKWYVDGNYTTTTWSQPFDANSLSAGPHTVTCEFTSGAPCADPKTITVTKNVLITNLSVSANTTICSGASTTLTASGSDVYSWSPATGLNTTTGSTVIASPAVTTTYTVSGGGCAPQQVTVFVDPLSALAGSPCAPPSGTPGGSFGGASVRNRTPVVLKGSAFVSTNVNLFEATDLVAFIYNAGSSTWTQVPLQVDEMKDVDAGVIYNNPGYSSFVSLQYCDNNTWVGADGTTTFDDDDEVVFMARDAGGDQALVSSPYPAGVVAAAGAEVVITDPNNLAAAPSYIYVFKKNTSAGLQQSAGKSYVNYIFSFQDGGSYYGPSQYKSNYSYSHHLENSTVTTPYYKVGFSDRWIDDEARVTIGSSLGIDLIDRHRNQFVIGNCSNEDYFTNCNGGVFVINKQGPLRAIRSHMGACSGPLTQREFIFYDQFEIIKTDLRVHQIPGMMDFWDYSPLAGNMRYSNNNNTTGGTTDPVTGQTGIPVDGSPDTVTPGPLTWQMMSSASGTIFKHSKINTNITPLAITSYYLDTNTPSSVNTSPSFQCPGGDGKAWGSSGTYINQNTTYPTGTYSQLPNTDPLNTVTGKTYDGSLFQNLQFIETSLFMKPETSRDEATALVSNIETPLTAVVNRWPATGGRAATSIKPVVDEPVLNAHTVNIYPNPSNGVVTIEAAGAEGDKIEAVFYDPKGKEIYRTQGTGSLKQVVNLQASAGRGKLYIAKIHIGGKLYTHKLIVTK